VSTDQAADGIRRIVVATDLAVRAEPGAHVDVQVALGRGRTGIRSYSVVESRADAGTLTLGVHLSPNTRGGSAFMHALRPGAELTLTAPMQTFPLRLGAKRYILLAGGIGITAIANMAAVLRRIGGDYTLVYVGRHRRAMAFLPELTQLHADGIRVHVDSEGSPLDVEALIDDIARQPSPSGTELYMCGPIRLMDAVRRSWNDHRLTATNLRYETFGNSGWFDAEEFTVRIPRLGLETTVGPHDTLLEALERAGADMMFDCRKGECGLCAVDIVGLNGHVDHRDVFFSESQKTESRKICSCVSRVVGGQSNPDYAGTIVLDIP